MLSEQEGQTLLNFNSIKVRSKRSDDTNLLIVSIFQFHKGTIETYDTASPEIDECSISIP